MVFSGVVLCNLLVVYQSFRGIVCLHLRDKVRKFRKLMGYVVLDGESSQRAQEDLSVRPTKEGREMETSTGQWE